MSTGTTLVSLLAAASFAMLAEGLLNVSIPVQNGFAMYYSCKDLLTLNPSSPSGIYTLRVAQQNDIQVYCEMGLNGGGYTFLDPQYIPYITSGQLASWFKDNHSFLIRVRKINGAQLYGSLTQLPEYSSIPLKLGQTENTGYNSPVNLNAIGKPYLYYGFLPSNRVRRGTVQGLMVNGVRIAFSNCDANANNHFALFPNSKEHAPSTYSVPGPVCNSIFSNLRPNPSARVMPETFFMFGETHWGGCGCYVQSNQQSDILSWAIGFR